MSLTVGDFGKPRNVFHMFPFLTLQKTIYSQKKKIFTTLKNVWMTKKYNGSLFFKMFILLAGKAPQYNFTN